MKVAVGSLNPVKIEAVKEAFGIVWPDKGWEVSGVDASSGVSDQPMSDKESIRGAKNRAKRALGKLDADFGVGIEGGLHRIGKQWFDTGWMVIINKASQIGISSTMRAHMPVKMISLIEKGYELGQVDDIIFKKRNSKQDIGHFGLMTQARITRKDAYCDALIMALSTFLHKDLFNQ